MRADRLLSLLLLLQTRGRATAARLADELEVSIRTIYRDFYALRVAGFPVYTEAGRGGGCYLHEDYRTDLTGLTADELRALFAIRIPGPLSDLGLGQALRGALLKIAGAEHDDGEKLRDRIVIDSVPWGDARAPTPQLHTIQQAVWSNRWVDATFLRVRAVRVERRIAPYGLVAKSSDWYVVWGDEDLQPHVDRVAAIVDAAVSEAPFERPQEFDLPAFWAQWCDKARQRRTSVPVTIRASFEAAILLEEQFSSAMTVLDSKGSEAMISIAFENLGEARARLLAHGGAIEVISPRSLRLSVTDFAMRICERHSSTVAEIERGLRLG